MIFSVFPVSDVETVGNVINPGLYTSTSGTSTWIEGDAALPDATLVRWRIFSTYAHKPVRDAHGHIHTRKPTHTRTH